MRHWIAPKADVDKVMVFKLEALLNRNLQLLLLSANLNQLKK